MSVKLNVEKIGDIKTTLNYWDCECEQNYIHNKEQSFCVICNAFLEEQPDSRLNEVNEWLKFQN